MNMLDGLKVSFDENEDDNYVHGVVIQTQLVENDYLFAIMDRDGYIYVIDSDEVKFHDKDIEAILNKPMEVISKVIQAERADSMERRTQILDIRS